ncbi:MULTISPECIES: ribonuclease H-like domain-containing protein [Halorussus]|uniref:ribonuclease H-like domain-containing protein n=1 Tax=Halorussus TaxID=1070314 RepID=UPI00209DA705|nr:ribonuclease H-like domain-containing protein [Halorussus vallis]USZ78651.1 ribonuclease H-like domain-containing protein [Halorussus vallis]USZ78682.1 ribonuclease H-like domain-containing protein [Halorussus vallis]
MFELNLPADKCYDSIGTLDIETSGFDGDSDDLIAIGVGYHELGSDDADVTMFSRKNVVGDETDVIRSAYEWLNDRDPEALVSYGADFFDLTFLGDKIEALGFSDCPTLACASEHVDLLEIRKPIADEMNKKWPSLEEALDYYEIPECVTTWEGAKLDNTRFGEELAPKYIESLPEDGREQWDALEQTVLKYTESDIEANIALYAADTGHEYMPTYAL